MVGLEFGGGALLIGGLLALVVLAYYFTSISRVLLFWVAFVLTWPFGATFGDLLTKSPEEHGLGFGTIGSSLILLAILVGLVVYTSLRPNQPALASGLGLAPGPAPWQEPRKSPSHATPAGAGRYARRESSLAMLFR